MSKPTDENLEMIAPAVAAFETALADNGVSFTCESEDWGYERAWIAAVQAVLANADGRK